MRSLSNCGHVTLPCAQTVTAIPGNMTKIYTPLQKVRTRAFVYVRARVQEGRTQQFVGIEAKRVALFESIDQPTMLVRKNHRAAPRTVSMCPHPMLSTHVGDGTNGVEGACYSGASSTTDEKGRFPL